MLCAFWKGARKKCCIRADVWLIDSLINSFRQSLLVFVIIHNVRIVKLICWGGVTYWKKTVAIRMRGMVLFCEVSPHGEIHNTVICDDESCFQNKKRFSKTHHAYCRWDWEYGSLGSRPILNHHYFCCWIFVWIWDEADQCNRKGTFSACVQKFTKFQYREQF